jgi:hypothetical protein
MQQVLRLLDLHFLFDRVVADSSSQATHQSLLRSPEAVADRRPIIFLK